MDEYLSAQACGDAALHSNDRDMSEQVRLDAALDEALCCTFPASDPVALDFAMTSHVSTRAELIRRAFPRRSS